MHLQPVFNPQITQIKKKKNRIDPQITQITQIKEKKENRIDPQINGRKVIPLKVKRNLWVGYATNFESWITFIVVFFVVL